MVLLRLFFIASLLTSCTQVKRQGDFSIPDVKFKAEAKKEYNLEWPIEKAKFVRGFNPKGKDPHFGLDLSGPKGTPIYSASPGVVIYAGSGFTGYGNFVMVSYRNTKSVTLYGHLDRINVKQGQTVSASTVIGHMGNTGRSTGTHLHFELRTPEGPLNPIKYLP